MTVTDLAQTRDYWVLQVNDRVSLRIAKKHMEMFPPLENYLHRTLEVRGWMSKRRDQYRLFIAHPSVIKVLD